MTEEQAAKLIEQNERLLEENATLRSELQQQKDLVAALIYVPKSEQLSHDQLLMAFLEDESKKPDAAGPDDLGPAADKKTKAPRAKRTSKLADSLTGLPTRERVIVSDEVLRNPEAYRLIGEEVNERLEIIPVSCLAHIRRKFTEARGDHPRTTGWILYQIGKIYHIEARLKERRAGPELRRRARRLLLSRSYRHLAKLFDHLDKHRSILPKSSLGKALAYARDQWTHLMPCFEDGRIEFDNNLTEGAIRPTKLGMKNWMFIGGKHTGQRSAIIYTFVEQVRRRGHDPRAYFEWVFDRLMRDPEPENPRDLLPTAWIEQREACASGKKIS